MKKQTCYWIYMLECDNGTYYTGYTKNLARRFRQHVDGTANVKYTRSYKPLRIAQCWRLFENIGTALKVEILIKRKPRAIKNRLVSEPGELRELATARLDRDLEIFTFNPMRVEEVSRGLDADALRNGADPFSGTPAADY